VVFFVGNHAKRQQRLMVLGTVYWVRAQVCG
jgi:hypothetical protein